MGQVVAGQVVAGQVVAGQVAVVPIFHPLVIAYFGLRFEN
jgi:hypothetical protein